MSRSREVKPSRSVKVPSEQSQPQPRDSSEAAPWEAHKEQDRHVETFGIGTSGISELRHRWLSSGRRHASKSRRLFSNFVTTTPWPVARRVCQRQAKESYDEEPSAWGGKLSETQRTLHDQAGPGVTDEWWSDLLFQEGFAWRALRLPAKFPNSNRPTPRVPERQATGQETAQRTSAATPANISGSHVTIAARSSLGSAGASRTSRIRVKPGGTFVCARRKTK